MARSGSQQPGRACPRCSMRAPASAKFCAQCGAALTSVPAPTRRSRRRGRRLAVAAVALLVLAVVVGNLTDSTGSDDSPAANDAQLAAATVPATQVSSTATSAVVVAAEVDEPTAIRAATDDAPLPFVWTTRTPETA